jgi:DNA-binding beta-propeller fold protein YncE
MYQVSNRVLRVVFCAVLLATGIAAVPARMAAQQPYHVIAKWVIGGDGGWDYLRVDPATHRLYVAHGPQVQVVDTTSGKLVGAITGLVGTHGIAFDATGKYGYISDGRGSAVVVFDRSTLAKVASINVADGPDGIVYEPVTKTVWTFNSRGSASVIDTAAQKLVATIKMPSSGEAPVVDGKGFIYGNVAGKIVRFDAHTRAITATWVTGCDDASGSGIDIEGHRLFQACAGKRMMVVDSATGKVLGQAEIGDDPDSADYSPKFKLAFASTNDGLLSVVGGSGNAYKNLEKLPTQKGARTMTYDPATDRVYTATANIQAAATAGARASYVPGTFTVFVIGR